VTADLRCLTVRQPWAWAIIHGGKDVENRTRNIAGGYRGPVAIHAGLQVDHEYDRHLIGQAVGRLAREHTAAGMGTVAQFGADVRTHGNEVAERYGNRGAILGVVDLVDMHHGDDCHEATYAVMCSPWAQFGVFHLALTNPRPLAHPIPARGRLGLWRPDDTLTAAIWEQVSA